MGGMGDGMMGGGSQSSPKTLAEFADQSFASGNDKQGIELTFAAAIADDNYAAILSKYRWVDAIKQPALAVRIGIGLKITESKGFSGDPKPIGKDQQLPQIGGNRPSGNNGGMGGMDGMMGGMEGMEDGMMGGMGEMEGMMGGMGGGSGLPADLTKYTGELGEKVVEKLRERIKKGEFGTVLQTALGSSGGGASGGMDGMGGMMGGMDGGMDGGMMGGMGGEGGGAGGKKSSAIMPGVTMLGQGTIDGVLGRAAAEGIDAVLLFDVQVVSVPKVKLVRNTTTLQLYDVASRRKIESTSALVNILMQNQREKAKKEKKPDPLDTAIEKVIKRLDMSYKMRKMPPTLTADWVETNRLVPLVSDKPSNPLRALAEVMFYHQYKLCPDENRKIAFDMLAGPQIADQLLNGSKQEKLAAVDVYLDVETAKVIGQSQGQQSQANPEGGGLSGGAN